MSIELPKDAEGREIPLDTVVLFGGNGNAYNITGWIYVTDFDLSNSMAGQWRALTDKFTRLDPELMYLTPPDSWEKLEEDFDRCIEESNSCWYFSPGGDCFKCARPDSDTCGCTASVFKDIKRRIRRLRGEN